jgi:protein-L-isoaspartate(D-aspartate) O-methyltransferase
MIDHLNLQHDSRTLEIGTGSGYNAAIMSHLCANVVTIERIPELVTKAQELFNELQITNVTVIQADGAKGYAQGGPYDRIVSTAAMKKIPVEFVSQLTEGGSILLPIGDFRYLQDLVLGTKQDEKIQIRIFDPVEFVPLITDTAELGWSLPESLKHLNATRFDH